MSGLDDLLLNAAPTATSGRMVPLRYTGVRVLVFGAAGFIGRWVARELSAAGASLTCAVRDAATARSVFAAYGATGDVVTVDLSDAVSVHTLLDRLQPSIVFNLAGYGVDRAERDDATAWRINAEFVAQLGGWAAQAPGDAWRGLRLVHTGSALEYGPIGGSLPETANARPTTLYGETKLAGTRALLDSPGVRAVTARLFTVYGPGEHAGRLLPSLLEAAAKGRPVPLSLGLQRRDFTYVQDVAEGLLRLGRCAKVEGGIVNLATGVLERVCDFADTAAEVLDMVPGTLQYGALPQRDDEMPHDAVSIDRLRRTLGWIPSTPIADGISRSARFLAGLPS